MTSPVLPRLLPQLMSIPAAAVMAPNQPVFDFIEDAFAYANKLRAGALGTNPKKLRLDADMAATLHDAAIALAEAQAEWNSVRFDLPPDDAKELEIAAEAVYQRIRAAAYFVSDSDLTTRRAIKAANGDESERGAAFFQLAAELDRLRGEVRPTDEIDVDALITEARDWGIKLFGSRSGVPSDARVEVMDVRDRAFTWLDIQMDRVDAAAAYFFAGKPVALRAFRGR